MRLRPKQKPAGADGGTEEAAPDSTLVAPARRRGLIAQLHDQDAILAIIILAATAIAYQQAWFAGYIWDDDVYVTGNKLLTAPDGLRRIWFSFESPSQYFPLTYTSFRLERALWGLHPAGYHWVNILLHAGNALLVWRLLRILVVPGAWIAAALFALHPVHVESVAWITERKNVLMGFFFLLALLSWTKFLEKPSRRAWGYYASALLFYVLALFSKTTACTLPAGLLLVLWWRGEPITRWRLAQITPFVAFGLAMGLVSIWWERFHQGAQGDFFQIGLLERILLANRALWFYVGKLLWPANLSFSYPRWEVSASDPFAYLWVLATLGLGVAIYCARRYLGRGVEVAALFFAATLSPMLGFLMLYTFRFSFVADHYQYLATIGPLALAGAGLAKAFSRAEKKTSLLRPLVCGALLGTLGLLTWRQCAIYRDIETLWRSTIDRNPASWMAHNNLGTTLLEKGRITEAIGEFEKALRIDPRYAAAQGNLGNALLRLGEAEASLLHLQSAVEIDPLNAMIRNNLGNALLQLGRENEAAAQYAKAVEIDATYVEAHNNLGALALRMGRKEEAVAHLRKALALNSESADAHNNLGNTLAQLGKQEEALHHYESALVRKPADVNALNNLAWLLATSPDPKLRNGPKAVELAQRADQLTESNSPVIVATLSAAYAEEGRFPEAIETAKLALSFAAASRNSALVEAIRAQIQLYEAGSPSREQPPSVEER